MINTFSPGFTWARSRKPCNAVTPGDRGRRRLLEGEIRRFAGEQSRSGEGELGERAVTGAVDLVARRIFGTHRHSPSRAQRSSSSSMMETRSSPDFSTPSSPQRASGSSRLRSGRRGRTPSSATTLTIPSGPSASAHRPKSNTTPALIGDFNAEHLRRTDVLGLLNYEYRLVA
jgi:hypothetical protein